MARRSPYITLLSGCVLAAVLVVADYHATTGPSHPKGYTGAAAATSAPPAASPSAPATTAGTTAAPEPSASPPAVATEATYAGYTTGGAATLAVAVHGETAIAYLCDGSRLEAWLRGTATGGTLALTGAHGASLTGALAGGRATGTVLAGGQRFTYTIKAVYPPSGLYRAAADVRGAQVVAGWIVVDGRQVGIASSDGGQQPQPAPTLDTTTLSADLGGTPVTATAIDGITGSGF
jgi:serine/threonine-protein kinase